jgi:predicted Holliday junction resolvase-like endonuclease
MDTWVIVLIVVAVVIVLALIAMTMAKRSGVAKTRKREQAREHLQEAQVRTAKADREQALAEEQAARARREKAEAEERAAVAEREARERVAQAHDERSTAEELRAKAEKLAPGLGDGHAGQQRVDQVRTEQAPVDQPLRPDEPGGGATRR